MFDKRFIDARLAAGALVFAGVKVVNQKVTSGMLLVDSETNEIIAHCYRNGAAWSTKAETIELHIEKIELARTQATQAAQSNLS